MDNENKKSMTGRGIAILLVSLLILALVVTVIIVAATSGDSTMETSSSSYSSNAGGSSSSSSPSSSSSSSPDTSDSTGDNVPTVKEIVFIIPVENGSILKEYTDTTIVWSETLGMYTGHMGMDIAGSENARVLAAYDGVVVSIVESYLEGVTVVIDHGDGLQSIYNSLEVDENLEVGDRVLQGDTLGVISTNNRQEYKDGAHLHFEVTENGVRVAPTKYLMGLEK